MKYQDPIYTFETKTRLLKEASRFFPVICLKSVLKDPAVFFSKYWSFVRYFFCVILTVPLPMETNLCGVNYTSSCIGYLLFGESLPLSNISTMITAKIKNKQ